MWLNNLRLVLPDGIIERGAMRIEGETIAEIIEGDAPETGLDTGGMTALPGLIDLHGDMLERDIEPRPRARFPVEMALFELDKRMAGTGITTAYAAVAFAWNSKDIRRQETAEEIIRAVHTLQERTMVEFRVHARFEMVNADTVPLVKRLLSENLIDLISLMDHTPGQGQYSDLKRFLHFLDEWLGIGQDQLSDQLQAKMQERVAALQQSQRDWTIARDVSQAAQAHGTVIASHDDDSPEKVHDQHGFGVTISEFPVTVEAAQTARDLNMHIIMGAPNAYRGGSNTGNLSAREAIAAGLVDILATDYFPAALLQTVFLFDHEGFLPLHEGIKLVSQNPADAMGLHDRGRLEVGRQADLVLVGDDVYPRVRATFRAGHPIYWDPVMAELAQEQRFALV